MPMHTGTQTLSHHTHNCVIYNEPTTASSTALLLLPSSNCPPRCLARAFTSTALFTCRAHSVRRVSAIDLALGLWPSLWLHPLQLTTHVSVRKPAQPIAQYGSTTDHCDASTLAPLQSQVQGRRRVEGRSDSGSRKQSLADSKQQLGHRAGLARGGRGSRGARHLRHVCAPRILLSYHSYVMEVSGWCVSGSSSAIRPYGLRPLVAQFGHTPAQRASKRRT